jgi:hypothetical protein
MVSVVLGLVSVDPLVLLLIPLSGTVGLVGFRGVTDLMLTPPLKVTNAMT